MSLFLRMCNSFHTLEHTGGKGEVSNDNKYIFSLPGYAFSDGPKKPGFGAKKMAEALNRLMKKLGYELYGNPSLLT